MPFGTALPDKPNYTSSMPRVFRERRSEVRSPFPVLGRQEKPEPTPRRVAKLEATIAGMQRTLDVQFKRIAQMQVQLDGLIRKTPRR